MSSENYFIKDQNACYFLTFESTPKSLSSLIFNFLTPNP
jgi:hypothetical protein